MIYVSELLKEVCRHDQVILDLLQSKDSCGLTTIQVSNELKRARSDVKFSMDRLLQAKKVKRGSQFNYGRWTLVNYDFTERIINKRPNEAADTMRELTEENARLKRELEESKQQRNESSRKWREAFDSKDLQCQSARKENARLREALGHMVRNFDYHCDRLDSAQCNSLDEAKQLLKHNEVKPPVTEGE